MAEKPTGPVKPPILDLKANAPESGADTTKKPAEAPAPSASTLPPKPETKDKTQAGPSSVKDAPKNPAPEKPKTSVPQSDQTQASRLPILPLALTGIGGAAIGVAAAYGLAVAGYWPSPAPSDFSPLETRIARIENALEVNTSGLGDLGTRLGALESAPGPTVPDLPDNLVTNDALDAINNTINALRLEIDAVAAGSSGEDAAQLAQEISRISAGLAELQSRVDQPDPAIESLTSEMSTITDRVGTLEEQAAEQASLAVLRAERDRFASIPGTTAMLETAIASGNPFGAELSAIESLMPELGLTNSVRTIAANGLKPSRLIARDFRALIPTLLTARPQNPDAGWLDTLLEQAQSAVALRPVNDDGDTPEAIIGRIESALENGRAEDARALILTLPDPMQASISGIRADLDAMIAVQSLVADIRTLAPTQSPEAGQ